MNLENKNVIKLYNLPEIVKFCKECTVSNQRPRISFDENGVCSACNFAKHKKKVNWSIREQELLKLLDKHRKNDGSYDVVVPCSGGKDGGFVAHMLKYKYGMNPLTVTWAPSVYTDIGRKNLDNFINIGGFDNILGSVNGKIHRKMAKLSFIKMGDNFFPFVYGQTNFPLKMAAQHGISLVMYGENGEVEYGGDMKLAYSPVKDMTHYDNIFFSNMSPLDWENEGVSKKEIVPYLGPTKEEIERKNIQIHFFGYYHFWDPQENFYYCSKNNGFQVNDTRSEGTYSKYASLDDENDWLHYYLSYIKFGIGRATSDTAHEIRDGKITRDEGVALVKKYDGELTKKYFKVTLKYLDITEKIFWQVIDSWRSPHIWKKLSNSEWKLRNPIWSENCNEN
jgi:N-acetyl sugar amidotransferase